VGSWEYFPLFYAGSRAMEKDVAIDLPMGYYAYE